jgi:hypothetical protein
MTSSNTSNAFPEFDFNAALRSIETQAAAGESYDEAVAGFVQRLEEVLRRAGAFVEVFIPLPRGDRGGAVRLFWGELKGRWGVGVEYVKSGRARRVPWEAAGALLRATAPRHLPQLLSELSTALSERAKRARATAQFVFGLANRVVCAMRDTGAATEPK